MREMSVRERLHRLDDLARAKGEILVTRRDDLCAAMTRLDTPSEVLVRQDRDQR